MHSVEDMQKCKQCSREYFPDCYASFEYCKPCRARKMVATYKKLVTDEKVVEILDKYKEKTRCLSD